MVCPCGIDLLEDRGSAVQCISGGVLTAGNAVSGFYLRCAATSVETARIQRRNPLHDLANRVAGQT